MIQHLIQGLGSRRASKSNYHQKLNFKTNLLGVIVKRVNIGWSKNRDKVRFKSNQKNFNQ